MDSCPECGELLPPKAIRCACGWKSPPAKERVEHNRLCEWVEAGIRCGKAGSVTASVGTQGRWYCTQHFFGMRTPKRRQSGMVAVAELTQQLRKQS